MVGIITAGDILRTLFPHNEPLAPDMLSARRL